MTPHIVAPDPDLSFMSALHRSTRGRR